MRAVPWLFAAACTFGGVPRPPIASAVPRCPDGKRYFLGVPEPYRGQHASSIVRPIAHAMSATRRCDAMPIVTTDLNGDGNLDVLVSGPDDVTVYINDGDGTLAAPMRIATGRPCQVATGDLSGGKIQSVVVVAEAADDSELFVVRASCR